MTTISEVGFYFRDMWLQMEVNQLGDVFSWASTATDNGSDCNGILVYLFQEVKLLGSGWGYCCKGKILFCEGINNSFLVH